jgi:hypothetical protein
MRFIVLFLLHPIIGLHIGRREILKIAPLFLVNPDEKDKVNIKFCKDCKFFKNDFLPQTKFGHCTHFPFQPSDYYLVDGVKDTSPSSYYYCTTARSSERMCGTEGKYFESK